MIPHVPLVTVSVRRDYTILDLFEQDASGTISEDGKRKLDEWCANDFGADRATREPSPAVSALRASVTAMGGLK